MKLNLGCGSEKLEGYINVDCNKELGPDLLCDFTKDGLPYANGSVEQVVLFHTIEHIQKSFHLQLLLEIRRVLCPDGTFLISYPEFTRCYENWRTNHRGKREFWEATIFGRQSSPSDYHVCIMDTPEFSYTLRSAGFRILHCIPEVSEPYNTVIKVTPDILQTYSEEVRSNVWTEKPLELKS